MNGQDYFELANNRLIVLSPKRCREPDCKTLPRKSHPKTNAAGVLLGATGCGSVLIQYFQIGPSPVRYKESDSSLIRVNESSWGALKPPPVGVRQIQDRVQILADSHPSPSGLDHCLVTHRFNGDDRVEVEQNPGIFLGTTGRRSLCQFHEVCHFLFPFFRAD